MTDSSDHCIECETKPIITINGKALCLHHAEQHIEFSEREAPLIAYTKHVEMHPQRGASTSGTPRHYK